MEANILNLHRIALDISASLKGSGGINAGQGRNSVEFAADLSHSGSKGRSGMAEPPAWSG